jgi:hypothetical protein
MPRVVRSEDEEPRKFIEPSAGTTVQSTTADKHGKGVVCDCPKVPLPLTKEMRRVNEQAVRGVKWSGGCCVCV